MGKSNPFKCFLQFFSKHLSGRTLPKLQDPYYREYFVKSCGGFYGMPNVYHPWREIPGAKEGVLGSLKVNLTFAPTITTLGGTSDFDLRYTCRKNLCSGERCIAVVAQFFSRVLFCISAAGTPPAPSWSAMTLVVVSLGTVLLSVL